MKQRKKGIVLIIVAVLIFATFMGYEFFGKRKKTEPVQPSVTATIPSATPIATAAVTITPKPPADAEMEEDKKRTSFIEIRAEILQQLQVSNTEFEKQIQIFQNAFGYAGAKKVKDMGELSINYTEETMTIPCYMMVNKKVVKFDAIYNMNKKTWRFVPW